MNKKVNPSDKPWLVNHLEVNQPNVDLSELKQKIGNAHQANADFVILSLHFSNAYQAYPCAHVVENTQRIFEECGPDIVLGGHAHNVQPMAAFPFTCPHTGVEKRGFVVFSLGDFVAYDIFNWCHLSVYLKLEISQISTKNAVYTEGSSRRTILTKVEAVPIYACGNYRSRTDKELRFLDARKTMDLMECGETPTFMTPWNVRELKGLMQFYNSFFDKK